MSVLAPFQSVADWIVECEHELNVVQDQFGEELVNYYFGNLDPRRVVWHEGRDLHLEGASETINYLPWFDVEVDEKPADIATRKLTFTEVK